MTIASDTDTRGFILATGQNIMAQKGFSAVGLTEILSAAGVPKGSFYHYFASKDAFGEAMLKSYFDGYLADMDEMLSQPDLSMAERLMTYWDSWFASQGSYECQGRCLAVKLGAEVADLSEAMRLALKAGTQGIIARLARAIEGGMSDGSLSVEATPKEVAAALYDLWLGASVMTKIERTTRPLETAMRTTRWMLGLPGVNPTN